MKLKLSIQEDIYFLFIHKGIQEQADDKELKEFKEDDPLLPEIFNGTVADIKKSVFAGCLDGINLHPSFTHIILF